MTAPAGKINRAFQFVDRMQRRVPRDRPIETRGSRVRHHRHAPCARATSCAAATRGSGSWRSMSTQYRPPRLRARATDLRCESRSGFSTITGNVSDMKIAASNARSGRRELFDRPAVEAKIRDSPCDAPPRSSWASDRFPLPRSRRPRADGREASHRTRCRGCGASDFCDADSRPAAEKRLRPESRRDSPNARGGRCRDIRRCSVPSAMSVPDGAHLISTLEILRRTAG